LITKNFIYFYFTNLAPVPQVPKPVPVIPAPKVDIVVAPTPASRIKDEPMTSPTIPKQPVEPKPAAAKPPPKKAEPKPKPPAPQPKELAAVPAIDKIPVPAQPVVQTMPKDHFRQCLKVLRRLGSRHCSLHFRAPVDPIAENIPHYPEVIKQPMDLKTMKAKLEAGKYHTLQAFEADFRLMMSNCFLFNQVGSFVYTQGQEMEELFDSEWTEVMEDAGVKVPELNITIVETPKGSSSTSSSSAPMTKSMSSSYPPPQPRATAPKPLPSSSDAHARSTSSAPTPPLPKASKPSTPKPPVPVYTPPSVPLGASSSSTVATTSSIHQKEKSVPTNVGPAGAASSSSSKSQSSSGSNSTNKSADMAKAKRLLVRVKNAPCASEFKEPVDPILQGIPLYPKIITSPMDLGTIERKIDEKRYRSIREIKDDLDLVISNCRKFNPRGCFVVDQADLLEGVINKDWENTFGNQTANGNDTSHANNTPASKAISATATTSSSTNSKPKSKAGKSEDESKTPVKESAQPAATTTRRPSATPKPKPAKVAEKVVEPPQEVLQKHMDRILKKAMNHKHSGPFHHPVGDFCLSHLHYLRSSHIPTLFFYYCRSTGRR
jgi:outer membrane biosynthesis protein TonB